MVTVDRALAVEAEGTASTAASVAETSGVATSAIADQETVVSATEVFDVSGTVAFGVSTDPDSDASTAAAAGTSIEAAIADSTEAAFDRISAEDFSATITDVTTTGIAIVAIIPSFVFLDVRDFPPTVDMVITNTANRSAASASASAAALAMWPHTPFTENIL